MFLFLDKTIERVEIILIDETGKMVKNVMKKGVKNILPIIAGTIKNKEISGIIVIHGSDSFSISRSKVAIANTLSFVWDIPVIGLKRSDFCDEKSMIETGLKKIKRASHRNIILPIYDKEPNITTK